jgi:hypothetical protein
VRKDVERAFGVLKGTWQFLEHPILLMDLNDICHRVTCCLILHNMIVTDRVMNEPGMIYDPSFTLAEDTVMVEQPPDLLSVQANAGVSYSTSATGTGIANAPTDVVALLTKGQRFKELNNPVEYQRLHTALMTRFS